MNTYDMLKEEVPSHLNDLKGHIRVARCDDVRDDEYAKMGFLLMKVGDGDKKALVEVAEFIQKEHQRLKDMESSYGTFITRVTSWMYWAKNWTEKKAVV